MSNFDFKELHVWQRALDFAEMVISESEKINTPRTHYQLSEQLELVAAFISMNIAKGGERNSKKEFIQFLYIARGSLSLC